MLIQGFLFELDMKPHKYASTGNIHFVTTLDRCQTYQNYEETRQKFGTFLKKSSVLEIKNSKNICLLKVGLL